MNLSYYILSFFVSLLFVKNGAFCKHLKHHEGQKKQNELHYKDVQFFNVKPLNKVRQLLHDLKHRVHHTSHQQENQRHHHKELHSGNHSGVACEIHNNVLLPFLIQSVSYIWKLYFVSVLMYSDRSCHFMLLIACIEPDAWSWIIVTVYLEENLTVSACTQLKQ